MLTYNKGIYKKILDPLGVRYYIASESAGRNYFSEPSSREMVWEMLFSGGLRDRISLNKSSFTAMNQGKADKKNSTDAARERLKKALSVEGNDFYEEMDNHLRELLYDNAAIMAYVKSTGKEIKFNDLYRKDLDSFADKSRSAVDDSFDRLLGSLSDQILANWDEVKGDTRYDEDFIDGLKNHINGHTISVLGFICMSSLFADDDDDKGFFEALVRHYTFQDPIPEKRTVSRAAEDVESLKRPVDEKKTPQRLLNFLEQELIKVNNMSSDKPQKDNATGKTEDTFKKCDEFLDRLSKISEKMEKRDG